MTSTYLELLKLWLDSVESEADQFTGPSADPVVRSKIVFLLATLRKQIKDLEQPSTTLGLCGSGRYNVRDSISSRYGKCRAPLPMAVEVTTRPTDIYRKGICATYKPTGANS